MESKQAKRKEALRKAVLVVLFFLLVGSAGLILYKWDQQQGNFPSQGGDSLRDTIEFEGKQYVLNPNIETVLVMGLDKFTAGAGGESYYNDQQADFLVLVILDHQQKTISALHINRDTMAPVNVLGVAGQKLETITQQIALAHSYGNGKMVSLNNTTLSVSRLLYDLQIDHSLSVTMDAIQTVNDAVGGVTLEVVGDFTGVDDTLVEGQTVTLLGEHAMNYIRARHGLKDPSNTARMQRQRQYMTALYRSVSLAVQEDQEFTADTLLSLTEHTVSDLSMEQLQQLAEKTAGYTLGEIYTPEGESKMGQEFVEFHADMEKLKKLMIDLFYQAA